ncbi:MAG: class I SAM-dependent methyltransferase [Planctomycetes bacterium]|nr:class I SAM-dependent methyltransferase [Planctomycetota bacterium]
MRGVLRRIKRKLTWRLFYSAEERRHSLVGPARLWRMKRDFQIAFLKKAGLEPRHHLLDLGCGTLRGGIPLIDYLETGHYFGIEARKDVLDEGRRELQEAGLAAKKPCLLAGKDMSSVDLAQDFDHIWAFSVLIHMKDRILRDTLRFAAAHLRPGGLFHGNVNIGDRPDRSWQGFPCVSRPLAFYQEAAADCGLAVADLGPLTAFGHRVPDKSEEEQAGHRMLRMWQEDGGAPGPDAGSIGSP